MNTPTFKEQFDKITTAYFNNELQPIWSECCFIGNLLNGNRDWCYLKPLWGDTYHQKALDCLKNEANNFYTAKEILAMEGTFMKGTKEDDEESLFAAMDRTLDMLRKIHESKGEIIEDFEFKKRQLTAV